MTGHLCPYMCNDIQSIPTGAWLFLRKFIGNVRKKFLSFTCSWNLHRMTGHLVPHMCNDIQSMPTGAGLCNFLIMIYDSGTSLSSHGKCRDCGEGRHCYLLRYSNASTSSSKYYQSLCFLFSCFMFVFMKNDIMNVLFLFNDVYKLKDFFIIYIWAYINIIPEPL